MVEQLHTMMNESPVKPRANLSRHEQFIRHGVPAVVLTLGAITVGTGFAIHHLNESTEIGSSVETVLNGNNAINTVDRGVKDILQDHPTVGYDSVAGIVDAGMTANGDYVKQHRAPLQPGAQIKVTVKHNNWNTTYTEAEIFDPANVMPLRQPEK